MPRSARTPVESSTPLLLYRRLLAPCRNFVRGNRQVICYVAYTERLSDEPLTDTASIPNDNLEALFEFGQHSRKALKDFIESFPAPRSDILNDFEFVGWSLKATPKKIIIHVLTHEMRH